MKLGDLCHVITKGTTPTSVGFKFENDGVNFVKVESLTSNNGFIPAKFAKISSECNESLKRSQLQKRDILFSIAGALGRTAIVTEDILPANTNQALAIIRLKPNIEIDTRYLLYTLNSDTTKEQSERNKGGVAQQNLSLTQLKNYDVYLPPLPEQERIVAKLDAAFAEIDKAVEIAQDRKASLEVFQASVINNAFELLDNELHMGEIFKFVRGPFGGSLKKNIFIEEGFAVYEQQHAIKNQCNDFRYFISQEKFNEMARFKVTPNSILMSCSGTIGKTTIAPESPTAGIINQALLMIQPNESVLPKFTKLFMESARFSEQLMDTVDGAAQKNVASVKVLKQISMPVPHIKVQQEIVSRVTQIVGSIEGLKKIKEDTIKNYLMLKSSILKQELQSSEAA